MQVREQWECRRHVGIAGSPLGIVPESRGEFPVELQNGALSFPDRVPHGIQAVWPARCWSPTRRGSSSGWSAIEA